MGRIGRFAVVCATVLLVACDTGRRDEAARDEAGTSGTAGVSAGDRNFVEEALSAGMAEVELGRMAQQRAADAEVKQFADMLVRDHSQAGDSLKQLAQQHSIPARGELEERHRDLIDRLSNLKGADFDREYMDAMIDSHEDMVGHLQTRASEDRFGGNQASLNQWAANALPTTRRHLEDARRLRDRLNNRTTARP